MTRVLTHAEPSRNARFLQHAHYLHKPAMARYVETTMVQSNNWQEHSLSDLFSAIAETVPQQGTSRWWQGGCVPAMQNDPLPWSCDADDESCDLEDLSGLRLADTARLLGCDDFAARLELV